jgi:HD-GYP domain-containing protein (c-di-GMP phosphodiesterase class II)
MKLAARLGLLFLAAGVVPLGVTLLVLAPRGQDALRTSAKLLHEAEVDALRARVDSTLDDLLADARLLSSPQGSEGDVSAERRALLRFLLEKHQELTCVTLYDGARKLPLGQGYDRHQVDAADLALYEGKARPLLDEGNGPRLRASDFYPSAQKRDLRVTIVTDFPPAGERGQLAAEFSLGRIQELVARTRIGRRGNAFIVDGDGRLVAHRDLARALAREDLSSVSVVRNLKENIQRAQRTGRALTVVTDFTDEGVSWVGAYAPLGRLRWGVVVAQPRDDAYGLARATWAHAAAWTTLALLLSLVVAVFFARRITRPVARLVDGTKGLAGAAFGITVPVEGPLEIAELARTFNEASRRLARYDEENRGLLAAIEAGYLETLRALVNAIDAKDPYTAGHSQRTADFAVAIGRALRLSDEELKEIEVGGLLHDIGKIGIAEQILRKPATLDDDEMKIMRNHPSIGDGVVRDIELLRRIRPMVRNHHERYDGSGYPDGLKGEDIPLGARIIAVADTFDAITSDRCYQPGRPPPEAVPILRRLSGPLLDAKVVEALLDALIQDGTLEPWQVNDATANPVPPDRRRPTLEFEVMREHDAAARAVGKKS